jgi:hypothetical protein
MKTIGHERVGDVICMASGTERIDDSDWDACMAAIEAHGTDGSTLRILVMAKRAGPNAMQRARLYALAEKRDIAVALLTASPLARGFLQAFGWAARIQIRAFAVAAVADALEFVGAAKDCEKDVRSVLDRLALTVD